MNQGIIDVTPCVTCPHSTGLVTLTKVFFNTYQQYQYHQYHPYSGQLKMFQKLFFILLVLQLKKLNLTM